jgi:Amt family ammonium transporter
MVYASRWLETFVDDPVGAIAVHGFAGAWGTLAAGLFDSGGFSASQVGVQAIGIAAAFLWTFPVSYLVFSIADKVVGGIRINGEKERVGLDQLEHDVDAYPEFGMPNGEAEHTHERAGDEKPEPEAEPVS